MNFPTSNAEEADDSRLEDMIQIYAESKGFELKDSSHGDLRIYHRQNPTAATSFRLSDADHAMKRSIGEFDRFLDKVFNK